MSTTQEPNEPTMGPPPGAIPQPSPGPLAADAETARSGDTDVVFRLDRDVPLLHRLRELASNSLDRLFDNRRMVMAGVLAVLALGGLAVTMGGAYRKRPPVAPPAPPPALAQPAAVVAPPPAPAPVTAVAPVAAPREVAPPRPAPRVRPVHARAKGAPAKKATAVPPARPHPGPAHR